MKQITDSWLLKDGYTAHRLRKDLNLILYDEKAYNPRMRFTLFHEMAHICLCHTEHGPRQEKEADFFASQIMTPDIIIKKIMEFGNKPSILMLTCCFGLSKSAAEHKLNYLCSNGPILTALDDALLKQYRNCILRYFSRCVNSDIDVICDDI